MMRGVSFRTSSYPSPRRSIVPGAMFSTVMSAFLSSSLTRWTPRGDLRSIASDFLFALNIWKYHGSSGAFPGTTRRAGSPVVLPYVQREQEEIGRAHVELQSRLHLVCRLLLEKK